jgi:hypothetical protein
MPSTKPKARPQSSAKGAGHEQTNGTTNDRKPPMSTGGRRAVRRVSPGYPPPTKAPPPPPEPVSTPPEVEPEAEVSTPPEVTAEVEPQDRDLCRAVPPGILANIPVPVETLLAIMREDPEIPNAATSSTASGPVVSRVRQAKRGANKPAPRSPEGKTGHRHRRNRPRKKRGS